MKSNWVFSLGKEFSNEGSIVREESESSRTLTFFSYHYDHSTNSLTPILHLPSQTIRHSQFLLNEQR